MPSRCHRGNRATILARQNKHKVVSTGVGGARTHGIQRVQLLRRPAVRITLIEEDVLMEAAALYRRATSWAAVAAAISKF